MGMQSTHVLFEIYQCCCVKGDVFGHSISPPNFLLSFLGRRRKLMTWSRASLDSYNTSGCNPVLRAQKPQRPIITRYWHWYTLWMVQKSIFIYYVLSASVAIALVSIAHWKLARASSSFPEHVPAFQKEWKARCVYGVQCRRVLDATNNYFREMYGVRMEAKRRESMVTESRQRAITVTITYLLYLPRPEFCDYSHEYRSIHKRHETMEASIIAL